MTKKEGPDKLDLAAKEARECGLSYGKYMQIKDDPNKVAELKINNSPRLKWTAAMIKANEEARQDGPVIEVQEEKTPMGTGERALKLFALWEQGNGDKAIAQAMGMHYQSVFNWRRAMGLPANRGKAPAGQWTLVQLINGAYYAECKGGN